MAISRIGGTQGGAANAGAVTLTLPGSMSVDDLIIVAYGVGDDDFTQPTLAMTTAGYTELTTSTLSVDGGTAGDGNLAIFYKYHNGTDTTAVCAAAGTGNDSATCAALQVFRGVATAAQGGPLEIAIQVASGASGGDPNPPQVATFTEATSAIVIAGMVASATSALTLTAPANYTTNAVNGTGSDTFSGSMGLAYRLSGASDPEDPGVFTDSGAGAGWCAATLVLKAAPASQTLTGTTFTKAPTFPQAALAFTVAGTTFTKAPTFPQGQLNLNLAGTTFTKAPTFPQGALVQSGPQDITGTTFTKAPTFPQGALVLVITGTTFTVAPTFPAGEVIPDQPLAGGTYTNAPTFFVGTISVAESEGEGSEGGIRRRRRSSSSRRRYDRRR